MLADRAAAQAPTVDTSVPTLPGSGNSLLGQAPGSGGGSFLNLPGTGGILGGRPGVSTPKGIPTTISTPGIGAGTGGHANADFVAPARAGLTDGDPILRDAGNRHARMTTARPTE